MYGGRTKAQTQWTIVCFSYLNFLRHIYISAMHSALHSTTVLSVLGIYYLCSYFLAFIVLAYAKSLPAEEQFHFVCILGSYSLRTTRTRCIQNFRFYDSPYTQAIQAGTVLCQSLAFCYVQFFVWCILPADLSRYRNLNFAPVLLVSDSPGKSMHISIPVCNNVYSYIYNSSLFSH